MWSSFNDDYLDAIDELNGAEPSTYSELRDIIENSLVGMGQCFSEAMSYGIMTMTTEQKNIWIGRADSLLEIRKQTMELLFAENYSGLVTFLNSLTLRGSDSSDRYVLRDAIIWMEDAIEEEKDLYNLTSTDLTELSFFATESFGNYTEVLRGWLNMNYYLEFEEPENSILVAQENHLESLEELKKLVILNSIQSDCIMIKSQQSMDVNLEIIGIDGKSYISKKIFLSGEDCIDVDLVSGIYMIRITGELLKKPIVQTYLIN